jgi:anti-sigma B factor antagonist
MVTETYTLKEIPVVKPIKEIRVRTIIGLRTIFEEIEAQASPRVAIDLSDVTYIDSSGIGLLLNFAKRLKAGGRRLYLFNPSNDVKAFLYIAELDEVIPFFNSFDDMFDAIVNGRV